MKYVDIYVYGGYFKDSGSGYWMALLRYGKHERLLKGDGRDNTVRCTMTAIAEGLRALREPCNVTVYTQCEFIPKTFELGWKRKNNADLWMVIDDMSKSHTVCYKWYKDIRLVFKGHMERR